MNFIIIFVTIVTILLLSLNVMCEDDDIYVNRQNKPKSIKQTYNFNHPPGLENYNPIPVVVVYGEEEIREEKSLNNRVSTNLRKTPPNGLESKSSPRANSKVSDDDTHGKVLMDVKKSLTLQLKTDPYSVSDLQIPVAVVYDEPGTTRTNMKNYRIRTTVPNSRVRSRHPGTTPQLNTQTGHEKYQNDKSETVTELGNTSDISKVTNTKENVTSNEKLSESNHDSQKPQTPKIIPVNNKIEITTYRPHVDEVFAQNENKNTETSTLLTEKVSKRRERDPVVPIVESENRIFSHTGEFIYSYESGDGTKAQQHGELKSFDDDRTGEAVVGGFSYKDKDGIDFSLTYTADENGYRPVGAHLPTPPPIPPAIARALAYLATKPTPEPEVVTETVNEAE